MTYIANNNGGLTLRIKMAWMNLTTYDTEERQTDRQIKVDKQTDRQTERKDRWTDRQTERKDRWTDGQTDRQKD